MRSSQPSRLAGLAIGLCMVLLAASCATTNTMIKSPTPAPKPIKAAADTATLVVFRATSFVGTLRTNIFIDGAFAGQLRGSTWFMENVKPGYHYVIATGSENSPCAKINFKAGKVYYLMQFITPGFWSARSGFSGSNPQKFQSEVDSMIYLVRGEEQKLPVLSAKDYQSIIKDHEDEIKKDPNRHKDTLLLEGY